MKITNEPSFPFLVNVISIGLKKHKEIEPKKQESKMNIFHWIWLSKMPIPKQTCKMDRRTCQNHLVLIICFQKD